MVCVLLQSHHKGKYLLEHVCRQLNLVEKDYFGLRYVDHTRQRHWLDPAKAVVKQVKDMDPVLFSFRVKFYPPDPFRLKEEITRYQIYLQLKRDLLHGRLYCTPAEAALLAGYIIQCEYQTMAHSPTFPSLYPHHGSFCNPSIALPTSQLILQPFCCFTYIIVHPPTLLLLLLRHRLFTYVTWWAAHG